MHYEFAFKKKEDYEEVLNLVLLSYQWEYPVVGISRVEFSGGQHPAFTGNRTAWEHTVGVYRENGDSIRISLGSGDYYIMGKRNLMTKITQRRACRDGMFE